MEGTVFSLSVRTQGGSQVQVGGVPGPGQGVPGPSQGGPRFRWGVPRSRSGGVGGYPVSGPGGVPVSVKEKFLTPDLA